MRRKIFLGISLLLSMMVLFTSCGGWRFHYKKQKKLDYRSKEPQYTN